MKPNEVKMLAEQLGSDSLDFLNYVENKDALTPNASAFIRYVGFRDTNADPENSYTFSYYITEPFPKPEGISYKEIVEIYISELYTPETFYSLAKPEKEDMADYCFSGQVKDLSDEIRTKLAQLRQYGVSEAVLRELLEPTCKISRLHIRADFGQCLKSGNDNHPHGHISSFSLFRVLKWTDSL